MNLIPMLAPTAISIVSNLLSGGKEREKKQEDGNYKKLADFAISQLMSGRPAQGLPTPIHTMPPAPANYDMSAAVSQYQQGLQASGNPVLAGINVARSMYDNRSALTTELVSKAKGIGGWIKGIAGKLWDNRETLIGGAMDLLMKKPRLA
jgi:hypothetical protein